PRHARQALRVPHGVQGFFARGAREAAAGGEQRRLRVRRADAGAVYLLWIPHRGSELSDPLRARVVLDQLSPERGVRARRPRRLGPVRSRQARPHPTRDLRLRRAPARSSVTSAGTYRPPRCQTPLVVRSYAWVALLGAVACSPVACSQRSPPAGGAHAPTS